VNGRTFARHDLSAERTERRTTRSGRSRKTKRTRSARRSNANTRTLAIGLITSFTREKVIGFVSTRRQTVSCTAMPNGLEPRPPLAGRSSAVMHGRRLIGALLASTVAVHSAPSRCPLSRGTPTSVTSALTSADDAAPPLAQSSATTRLFRPMLRNLITALIGPAPQVCAPNLRTLPNGDSRYQEHRYATYHRNYGTEANQDQKKANQSCEQRSDYRRCAWPFWWRPIHSSEYIPLISSETKLGSMAAPSR
jgi:hypothetical protein